MRPRATYDSEDLLSNATGIDLRPLRRKNLTREESAYVEYTQRKYRKQIETTGSDFERQLPNSIHVVTTERFELEVFSVRDSRELWSTDLTHNLR